MSHTEENSSEFSDFSMETLNTRRGRSKTLQVLRDQSCYCLAQTWLHFPHVLEICMSCNSKLIDYFFGRAKTL